MLAFPAVIFTLLDWRGVQPTDIAAWLGSIPEGVYEVLDQAHEDPPFPSTPGAASGSGESP